MDKFTVKSISSRLSKPVEIRISFKFFTKVDDAADALPVQLQYAGFESG